MRVKQWLKKIQKLNAYVFDVGIYEPKKITVLANDRKEACRIVSEYRGVETPSSFIRHVYDVLGVIAVENYEE